MAVSSATLNDFPGVIARAWRRLRRALWIAASVFALVIVLEAVHLHQLLAGIHPVLAWTVTIALSSILAAFGGIAAVRYLRVPRVLVPPELPSPEAGWDAGQQRAYREFARRYLRRQLRNPHLGDRSRTRAREASAALGAPPATGDSDPVAATRALVEQVDRELDRVLEPLDRTARRLIRRAAVEVSVATAVSPSILLDSLITLSRNVNLIARLADLYYGRPGLGGTLRVVRDVLGAAVAAGALEVVTDNLASAASEITGSWSTRLLGPLGQGAVNGVVTMRLGAAARRRCRSLTGRRVAWVPWRAADYRRGMARLTDWLSEDVGPKFTRPLRRWLGGAPGEPAGDGPDDAPVPDRPARNWWSRWFGPKHAGDEPETPAQEGPAEGEARGALLEDEWLEASDGESSRPLTAEDVRRTRDEIRERQKPR